MKVLVVDDSQNTLAKITEILKKNNFVVETADNGALALDRYAKINPDLVILDTRMPIMDGLETLKRLKKLDQDAKIIILTATDTSGVLQEYLDRGALGHIDKPIDSDVLVSTIVNLLKAGCSRNAVMFFIDVIDPIKDIARKIVRVEVNVLLKDVQIIRSSRPSRISETELTKIREDPVLTTKESMALDGFSGYVTEISGQQNGAIITWYGRDELNKLRDKGREREEKMEYDNEERADIFNNKVFGKLVDSTGLRLTAELIRKFDENKDRDWLNKVDLAKARFEIDYEEIKVPIEVHLYLDVKWF